jgi:hypothetical protein
MEKERAQPGLAVPPKHGPKTETPRWWRGAVLNADNYTAIVLRSKLKNSGPGEEQFVALHPPIPILR